MARAKGEGKTPGSGRIAGTPNRRTVEVIETLRSGGFNENAPFLFFAEVLREGAKPRNAPAKNYITAFSEGEPVWSRPTLQLMYDCARELAAYVAPKRKAIELTGADGEVLPMRINYADLPEVIARALAGATGAARQSASPLPASPDTPLQGERGKAKATAAPRPRGAPRPGGRRA